MPRPRWSHSVYRNGAPTPIGTVQSAATTVTFLDGTVSPDTDYDYTIVANDGVRDGPEPGEHHRTHAPAPVVVPTAISMLDENTNGRVDRIHVVFSAPVTCSAPCLTPGSLRSSGRDRAERRSFLRNRCLAQPHRGLGSAQHRGRSGHGRADRERERVLSNLLEPVGFAASSPSDGMAPVPIDLTSSNEGLLDNVMEPGDTFTVTFSEPIDPTSVIAANVKQARPLGPGQRRHDHRRSERRPDRPRQRHVRPARRRDDRLPGLDADLA